MSMALPSGKPSSTHQAALDTPAASRPSSGWIRRLVLLGLAWVALYHALPRCLDIPSALEAPLPASTGFTDRTGQPLRRPPAGGHRHESIRFEQIPKNLVDATVSAEDQRFWSHGGIDGIGTVRAALDSIFAGRSVSGASTITQQLVKVASERYHNRTWKDKLREMAFARKVEITWDKERILTAYLQRVEYGNQATGCAAAASLYFKKPLEDLSLAECAFLAGLPQAPTRLNPYRNFEGAKKRQEWILSRMHDDGRLTATEASQAAAEPLRLRRWTGGFEAPHFVEMLLAKSNDDARLTATPLGTALSPVPSPGPASAPSTSTPGMPEAPQVGGPDNHDNHDNHDVLDVRTGAIRTTLDLELQHFCESRLKQRLAQLESQRVREAAVVVLDNRTGGVRALIGSPDFWAPRGGQVNGALAARSAGSTLKPFTYVMALQQGDSPATIVDDLPIEFMTPTGVYAPENYDHRHYGPMSYREALANSLNIAAVRVLQRIGGPEVLHATLRSLDLTTLPEPAGHYGLGLTLGNAEVRLLELANAYACLARLGSWLPVVVRADEEPPSPATTPKINRLNPEACWLIADILSDPHARARCFGLESPLRLPFPAAVKTGTSTDFRDNWCVGFTPEFTVAIWVGNFDRQPMDHVSGVTGAAPIWADIMQWLASHRGVTWFARPATIVRAADLDPLTGERVPERWLDRRPTVSDFCAADAVPAIAEMNRYDQRGRVILAPAYARWLRSQDNWLRTSEVALSTTPNPASSSLAHSPSLHITSPLAGSTLILDPDLPGGGRRLPLRASSPLAAPLWSSPSLAIDHQGRSATATLTPGQHEIRLHDPGTGQTATTSITVRSL